ncbi:ZPR1 zinc finger domain-containing protein [Candidatus Woesearchaeota archaeon]|jgi:zinc finger protein|nr:ZPR1 zinc finger domain-containing protein [Candidatus Woesearchaeota archaeon]MBT6519344.1 ZPR1 zinc finger domain-containing protein [Candidatus Woesearchaeota archaeon]MBT7366804.1 ZPR1 zinc finger domain-containing protein [Candidatus Woesearchaeota archaeon]
MSEEESNQENSEQQSETAPAIDGEFKAVTPADILGGETCPICSTKNLTLREEELEIPFFGNVYVFSMSCSNCKFHKADLECKDQRGPAKYTLDIDCEEDMKIRVIRSSEATIKIPRISDIEPGPAAQGFVTNVEGVFSRVKQRLEHLKESEEDNDVKKKIRNMIKKINRITWGQDKAKLIIEDPSGNSAIISEKVKKGKL